jgi:type III restriction enzyme
LDYPSYEPDFVVETKQAKYLCEPKRADLLGESGVQEKANAAAVWCEHATKHAAEHGAKPWSYLLIPHTAIKANMTLQGLSAAYTFSLMNAT